MEKLTCKLSALVFAELYRILSTDQVPREQLQDRLDELSYDLDWLDDAAKSYDAKWRFDAQYIQPDTVEDYALAVEHALLATWLLAGLRNTGDSSHLSASLRSAVHQRMENEAPSLAGLRPQSFSPVIRGWTLGMAGSAKDPDLPVIPGADPRDPHIAAAYTGLVEHVLHLHLLGVDKLWPELMGTAVCVRTGGLAEALRPPPAQRGLNYSIDLLMGETRRHVTPGTWDRLRVNWIRWVERRNVLTHVRSDDVVGSTFSDSADEVRTWATIEPTVLGATQFICQQISQDLQESIPTALSTDPWNYLLRSIQMEW